MKKAAILMCVLALGLTGCQNAELEECRQENAKLKAQITELEARLGETLETLATMTEFAENMEKTK